MTAKFDSLEKDATDLIKDALNRLGGIGPHTFEPRLVKLSERLNAKSLDGNLPTGMRNKRIVEAIPQLPDAIELGDPETRKFVISWADDLLSEIQENDPRRYIDYREALGHVRRIKYGVRMLQDLYGEASTP